MLAIPVLLKWAAHKGKVRVLRGVLLLTAVGGLAKWYLFVPGIGWWIVCDALFCTLIWSAMSTILPALIADIGDQHNLNSGQQSAGRFVALFTLVANLSGALAIMLAGLSINLSGFDAALGPNQSANSITNMRLILAGGTFIFSMLAWALVRYQIDENGK
jgi:GPH family glycoside/pentoside/hexuronide:cation symporter